ncbi:TonB-dependent receptor [candidate division KSB1 bacterium]|nr:TonB-dependent receptor [candidate division KSB1 bacterium]
MKKRVVSIKAQLLLVLTVVVLCGFPDTVLHAAEANGPQFGRWVYAESPYIVTGDVEVPAGKILIIEPGVIVRFLGNFSINVYGNLQAIGTENNRIIFTSIDDRDFYYFTNARKGHVPSEVDWRGVQFHTDDPDQRSWLQHVIIRYCQTPISVGNVAPVLRNLIISECEANIIMSNGSFTPIKYNSEQDYILQDKAVVEDVPEIQVVEQDTIATQNSTVVDDVQMGSSVASDEFNNAFSDENSSTKEVAEVDIADAEAAINTSSFSFGEVEVVSATRTLQTLIEAPSAITAIQEDQVTKYGQYNFADLFRLTPGVDVFATHTSSLNINPRGFNRLYSNRTLVLIDNRIVYTTFFGTVFWNTFPIGLQDVQSVEIIRGPSGSLYGANAVNGVVNITTKHPRFSQGVHVRTFLGTKNTSITELSYNGVKNEIAYSVSGSGSMFGAAQNAQMSAMQNRRGRAFLEMQLDEDVALSFDVGTGKAEEDQFLPWGFYAMPVRSKTELSYTKVNLRAKNLKFQGYYNLINYKSTGMGGNFVVDMDNSLFQYSLEYAGNIGSRNTFVAGTVFQRDAFKGNVTMDLDRMIEQYSIYLQDQLRMSDHISLTLGGRIDSKPMTTTEKPLRAALVLTPSPTHSFRISVSQGFRSPSLVEYYVISQFGNARVRGSTNLKPEKAIAFEGGYRALLADNRLIISFDWFRQNISDFIYFNNLSETLITFANGGKSMSYGGELEIGWLFWNFWRLQSSYAYERISDDEKSLAFEEASPKSKVSFSIQRTPGKGFFFNMWGFFASRTKWTIAQPGQYPGLVTVPAHFNMNLYAGYAINQRIRFGFSAINLLENDHNEFPFGNDYVRTVSGILEASF